MHRIEMAWPGQPRHLWAQHAGTQVQALASAQGLLEELREFHGSKASVWLDGKRVRLPKKKNPARDSLAAVETAPTDQRTILGERLGQFLEDAQRGN